MRTLSNLFPILKFWNANKKIILYPPRHTWDLQTHIIVIIIYYNIPIYVLLYYYTGVACAITKPARRPNTLSVGGRRVVEGDAVWCDVTVDVLVFTRRRTILPKLLSVSNASRAVPLPSSDKSTPPAYILLAKYYRPDDVQTMAYRLLRFILFSGDLKHRGPSKQ